MITFNTYNPNINFNGKVKVNVNPEKFEEEINSVPDNTTTEIQKFNDIIKNFKNLMPQDDKLELKIKWKDKPTVIDIPVKIVESIIMSCLTLGTGIPFIIGERIYDYADRDLVLSLEYKPGKFSQRFGLKETRKEFSKDEAVPEHFWFLNEAYQKKSKLVPIFPLDKMSDFVNDIMKNYSELLSDSQLSKLVSKEAQEQERKTALEETLEKDDKTTIKSLVKGALRKLAR